MNETCLKNLMAKIGGIQTFLNVLVCYDETQAQWDIRISMDLEELVMRIKTEICKEVSIAEEFNPFDLSILQACKVVPTEDPNVRFHVSFNLPEDMYYNIERENKH